MKIHFYGATGTVTGSNYLLEVGDRKILIDCGLFQSSRFCDEKNFDKFPYDPREISDVLVTHAHLDHTGRLPKLVRDGFRGQIYSTLPTKDFSLPLLLDSEHVLKEETERNHLPQLYSPENVAQAMNLWTGVPYHQKLDLGGYSVTFYDAGHILGSSFLLVEAAGKKIVFSGDLGNTPAPIIKPTEYLTDVDYCVIESTYGARVHEDEKDRRNILADVIKETASAGGVLMIPAFAMERTQELIFELDELIEKKQVPTIPTYVDSPLAIKLTELFTKYIEYFNSKTKKLIRSGDDIFSFSGLHLTPTVEESKAINEVPPPKIIVASSGMSQGGRILHHERRYLPGPENTILFIGYQEPSSLGRKILTGQSVVKIFGEDIPVRAKIRWISSYSAHADQPRLLNWLRPMKEHLKKVFVVHGEPDQSSALAAKIKSTFKVKSEVPKEGYSYDII